MFAIAIEHIAEGLNQYLKRQFSYPEDLVVVSALINPDGKPTQQTNNKLVLTLVNVEKDTVMQSANNDYRNITTQTYSTRALHLNLSLLISANFTELNYSESLRLLSATALFLHGQPTINHSNTPNLPENIEKLSLEMENLNLSDLSNLWGMLGAKHVPCLYYKIRSVIIQPNAITGRINLIESPASSVTPGK